MIDVDECAEMSDNCDDSLATCTNTVGSFMCILVLLDTLEMESLVVVADA